MKSLCTGGLGVPLRSLRAEHADRSPDAFQEQEDGFGRCAGVLQALRSGAGFERCQDAGLDPHRSGMGGVGGTHLVNLRVVRV